MRCYIHSCCVLFLSSVIQYSLRSTANSSVSFVDNFSYILLHANVNPVYSYEITHDVSRGAVTCRPGVRRVAQNLRGAQNTTCSYS